MSDIIHNGIKYKVDDKLSNKDMTGWDLSDRKDLDGKIIYNSCLSHETPNAEILPSNLSGAIFIACNLDNVLIPKGNQIIDCSVKRFQIQNDGEDWIIDTKTLDPVEPIAKKMFLKLGLSIDPADIPADKQDVSAVLDKLDELAQIKLAAIKAIEDAP